MIYLLDTSAFSALMRADAGVEAWLSSVGAADRVVICAISRGEILFGLERMAPGRRRIELEEKAGKLFAMLPCEPVSAGAGDTYANVKFSQQRRGLPLDENELWIAATALVMHATLVTRDTVFRQSRGLRWSNPKRMTPAKSACNIFVGRVVSEAYRSGPNRQTPHAEAFVLDDHDGADLEFRRAVIDHAKKARIHCGWGSISQSKNDDARNAAAGDGENVSEIEIESEDDSTLRHGFRRDLGIREDESDLLPGDEQRHDWPHATLRRCERHTHVGQESHAAGLLNLKTAVPASKSGYPLMTATVCRKSACYAKGELRSS